MKPNSISSKNSNLLWAPWRIGYIQTSANKKKGCVICKMAKEKKDTSNHIFIRRKTCFAVLNSYPYNNGHCMVCPYEHINDLTKLNNKELCELLTLIIETQQILTKAIKPGGFNIGLNIGSIAGAGIPEHIHIHIVPRWKGDTNFMPVLSDTKVISQSLDELYKLLKKNL